MKLRSTLLLSLLLLTLSIFGQGTVSNPGGNYQVTYPSSGSGTNSTTIIAGSNITITTNAANNFTIASTGGGSGIPTLNGAGTNTTLSGSTVNNTPVQILGYASQVSTLLQVGQLGGLGNKLFVVGPTGILYGDGSGLTNLSGASGGGTNMVPTSLSYSGGTNVALVGTLPTGNIGPIRYKLTMTTNTFMQVPSGSPLDGTSLIITITQNAAGTWPILHDTNSVGGFAYGIDIPLPLSNTTNSLKSDMVGYTYNAAANKWWVTSHIRGF